MKYMVYGYSSCPYCKKAVAALEHVKADYHYVQIEDKAARTAWMDEMGFEGEDRTFPRVYMEDANGHTYLIGGADALENHLLFD